MIFPNFSLHAHLSPLCTTVGAAWWCVHQRDFNSLFACVTCPLMRSKAGAEPHWELHSIQGTCFLAAFKHFLTNTININIKKQVIMKVFLHFFQFCPSFTVFMSNVKIVVKDYKAVFTFIAEKKGPGSVLSSHRCGMLKPPMHTENELLKRGDVLCPGVKPESRKTALWNQGRSF